MVNTWHRIHISSKYGLNRVDLCKHKHICMHVFNNMKRSFSLEKGRTWKVLEKWYFGGAEGRNGNRKSVFYQWILNFYTDGFLSSIMKILFILLKIPNKTTNILLENHSPNMGFRDVNVHLWPQHSGFADKRIRS